MRATLGEVIVDGAPAAAEISKLSNGWFRRRLKCADKLCSSASMWLTLVLLMNPHLNIHQVISSACSNNRRRLSCCEIIKVSQKWAIELTQKEAQRNKKHGRLNLLFPSITRSKCMQNMLNNVIRFDCFIRRTPQTYRARFPPLLLASRNFRFRDQSDILISHYAIWICLSLCLRLISGQSRRATVSIFLLKPNRKRSEARNSFAVTKAFPLTRKQLNEIHYKFTLRFGELISVQF